jgi:hypothetical protein
VTTVIDSRQMPTYTRRRRECDGCHERFTTREVIDDGPVDDAVDVRRRLRALLEGALEELQTVVATLRAEP